MKPTIGLLLLSQLLFGQGAFAEGCEKSIAGTSLMEQQITIVSEVVESFAAMQIKGTDVIPGYKTALIMLRAILSDFRNAPVSESFAKAETLAANLDQKLQMFTDGNLKILKEKTYEFSPTAKTGYALITERTIQLIDKVEEIIVGSEGFVGLTIAVEIGKRNLRLLEEAGEKDLANALRGRVQKAHYYAGQLYFR